MSIPFYQSERGRNFFESDLPSLIHALNKVAHEINQNTEVQYKIYESMQENKKTSLSMGDMTIEQLIEELQKYPKSGKVRVLGCDRVYLNRCGNDISFDDQPFPNET